MLKALIDTSTFVDLGRAIKHRRAAWAQNSLRHLLAYKADYPKLTLSAFTIFEHLDGLYRDAQLTAVQEFSFKVLPDFEVIYPDHDILALGAEINAALAKSRQSIGVVDTLIAATCDHPKANPG